MEQNEIERLIQDGELWNFLRNRLSQDVLTAYQNTFGCVQDLSTKHNWLAIIVFKLLGSSAKERDLFWKHLHSP